MHTKVVFQGAKALARIGCAVLRFNFRGVGRSAGAWDEGAARWTTFAPRSISWRRSIPGIELWAAGFSFGSYDRADGRRAGRSDLRADRHRAAGQPVRFRGGDDVARSRSSSSTARPTS